MEKILSQEERIRKAQEIYYRRHTESPRMATLNVNTKKDYKLLKKVFIQILICTGIYGVFSLASNKQSLFSNDVIVQAKALMSKDTNFMSAFEETKKYLNGWINKEKEEKENIQQENLEQKEETLSATEQANEENKTAETPTAEASSISQMQQDAEYIKKNFSIIKPLTGTITSRFGIRNPTTATVPTYHTGIDIAADTGTVYVAAMDGVVELVSSQGDYRQPCKDSKWRCYDFICTLQNYICKRRRKNKTRAENRRSWCNRKCHRTSFAF